MGMGRASIWFMGAAGIMVGLYFAALGISDKIPSYVPVIIFILTCVFAFLSFLTGIIYIYFVLKNHLNPVRFLDDIGCTYWTKEKQIQVNWLFCDYSKSDVFTIKCVARFGEQVINVDGRKSLRVLDDPKAECINGSRVFVEQSKHDIEVKNPDSCQLTLSVKPHGHFGATKKETKDVITQLVNH
jgi:hypothetical protein